MFQLINKDLSHLGDVELTYAVSDVWDMVQKSNVVGNGQTSLEDKNNFELFTIFLNLIGGHADEKLDCVMPDML